MTEHISVSKREVPLWSIKNKEYHFSKPLIMGILNVTPDSFSDGGKYFTSQDAVEKGLSLIDHGADIIDIGGESTRPGAKPVPFLEEMSRVVPIIESLAAQTDSIISIDTQKFEVAQAAVKAGAQIVNDISAGKHDERMLPFIAQSQVGYVMMHMQGIPATMQEYPEYNHVISEIQQFFMERLEAAKSAGIPGSRIVLDPGIGFGKRLEDNLNILANIGHLHTCNRPLLLGASRKSFIGMLDASDPDRRIGGSLAAVIASYIQDVYIFRVHDVAETLQLLDIFTAIQKHSV